MRTVLVVALVSALALAGCKRGAGEAAGNTATVAGDPASAGYVTLVALTPDQGMRMGKADAPVALIEYGSYTCPHCAAFDAEAMPTIRKWVAAGKLSYEFRSFIRDSFDLSAALVARCGGPAGFFPLSDQIFAAQQEWIGNAQNMTPSDAKKIDALPPQEQLYQITRVTGLNGFAGQKGVPEAKLHHCLVDQGAWNTLIQAAQAGEKRYKIEGTPTFILDGKVQGSPDWQTLQPDLARAIGG
jgi:protein-disulfide isomerase